MKKFFAAVLTVFLSLGLLTACEGGQQHGSSFAPAVQSVERSDTGSAQALLLNSSSYIVVMASGFL